MTTLIDKLGVYLITDRHRTRERPLLDVVEQALRGGVRAVQLRERDLETPALLQLARQLRTLTRRHEALLLINDRIDVALTCDADGVHLPTQSFRVEDARVLLGPERLIGVSTHHPEEVADTAAAGADFAVFGPVFDTPSKRPYGPSVGLDALADAARASTIPVLAIGGIAAPRVAAVVARGAAGVAVIRALMQADDVADAARKLVEEIAVG